MKYRIYPDGEVVQEDDFKDLDSAIPYYDDYGEVEVPDLVVEYIESIVLGK